MEKKENIKMTVFAALFTALVIVGTYLKIPIGPVPIVLSNFFVICAGLLLGKTWGSISIAVYLLLGVLGLPVFSQGGGIAILFGPTGGFLFGYLLGAFITGLLIEKLPRNLFGIIISVTAGLIMIYLPGIPWLKFTLDFTWSKAFMAGMVPFLIGDTLKGVAAVILFLSIQKSAPELFLIISSGIEALNTDQGSK